MKAGRGVSPRRREKQLPAARQVAIAREKATTACIAIFLTVLLDKEHADAEIIGRVWHEVNELSQEISEGRVNVKDLVTVLRDEYGIVIR